MRVSAVSTLFVSAVLCTVSFQASLQGRFVSDDRNAIVSNEWVTGDVQPIGIFTNYSWWGRTRSDAPGYRPLATLSFAVNHRIGGLEVGGYHAVNVALHALMAWLVYLLAVEIGLDPRSSLAAMATFAVLPIHSEAVAWVVGRAELLAALGFTASLIAAMRYRSGGGGVYLVASAAFYALGILSKENAVTLLAMPVVLTMVFPVGRQARKRDVAWAVSLVAVTAVYLALRATAGEILPEAKIPPLDNPLAGLDSTTRLLGALSVFGRYLYLTFVPIPLSVEYSFDELGIGAGFVWDRYTIVAIAGLVAASFSLARRPTGAAAVCLLMTAVTYSIVSNTVYQIGTVMGERLFYLPSVGICLACGRLFGSLLERYALPALACLVSLGSLYIVIDHSRSRDWMTPVSLFESAVRSSPRSARAHMELASAYGHAGRFDEALKEFNATLAIKPDYAAAFYNRANMYSRVGRFEEAEASYLAAIEALPEFTSAWLNLAVAKQARGRLQEAAKVYDEALAAMPKNAALHGGQAEFFVMTGNLEAAVASYTRALEAGGDRATVLANRAVLRHELGGCNAAIDDYLAAVDAPSRSDPAPHAISGAIKCLRALGRHEDAARVGKKTGVANSRPGR